MSLQVWLPLNGNLNNQGLSGENYFSALSYGEGKIGNKALDTNGEASKTFTYSNINGATKWSICTWLKIDSSKTFTNFQDILGVGMNNDGFSAGNFRIEHDNTSGGFQIVVPKSTTITNTNVWYTFYSHGTLAKDKWVHITITNDGINYKTYIDGKLDRTTPISLFTTTSSYLTGSIVLGMTGAHGYLNDVRIYDHCLSQKEVKEISKGLILHYPLNQPERNVNLLTGSSNADSNWGLNTKDAVFTTNVLYDYTEIITTQVSAGWYLFKRNIPNNVRSGLLPSTKYTFSFEAWSDKTFDLVCSIVRPNAQDQMASGTSLTINGDSQWHKYKITYTTLATLPTASDQYFYLAGGNKVGTVRFKRAKFELGENSNPQWSPSPYDEDSWGLIEYDTSGFGNHGIAESSFGENYLLNSTFSNGITNWGGVNASTVSRTTIDGKYVLTATKGTSNYLYHQTSKIYHTAGTNQILAFSAEIYSSAEQTINGSIFIDSSGWKVAGSFSFGNTSSLKVGWNHVEARIGVTTTDYSGYIIVALGCSGTNMQLYHPKLEVAAVTPWNTNSSESEFIKPYPTIGWSNNSPRYNGCYTFDDHCTRYIYRPTLKFINNPGFTFCCWAYPTSYERINGEAVKTAGLQLIMSQGREWYDSKGSYYYGCSFGLLGSTKTMMTYIGKTAVNSDAILNLNIWYHLCITYDGTNLKQYINGVLKKTTAIDSSVIEWGNAPGFVLGKMAYSYTGAYSFHPFVGNISDARVYVTPLSAADIQELYNSPISITKNGTLLTQGEVIES